MVVEVADVTKTFKLVRFKTALVAVIGVYGGGLKFSNLYYTSAWHTISPSLNICMNLNAKIKSTCVTTSYAYARF